MGAVQRNIGEGVVLAEEYDVKVRSRATDEEPGRWTIPGRSPSGGELPATRDLRTRRRTLFSPSTVRSGRRRRRRKAEAVVRGRRCPASRRTYPRLLRSPQRGDDATRYRR